MRRWVGGLAVSLMTCLPSLNASDDQGKTQVPHPVDGQRLEAPQHCLIESEKARVRLVVEVFDAEETRIIFSVDLIQQGVQPLLLEIHNRSEQGYTFRKAHIDAVLPASQVARYAYPDPATTAVRQAQWLAVSAPAAVLNGAVNTATLRSPMPSVKQVAKDKPPSHQDIQADFVRREIADAPIEPNGSLVGFVFVRLPHQGAPITVKLVNMQTHEPLAFEIPLASPSTSRW